MAERVILHVDMDAFFASVELLRHPELDGQPVVVGGGGDRGVVAAASYAARAFGVHSAMSTARARRLCPHLVVVSPDHRHYAAVSGRIMSLFRDVTPLVEPLSLDEAFLDISGTRRLLGEPAEVGARLRTRVSEQEGLDCSIGIASSKSVAKLASKAAKPAVGERSDSGAGPHTGVLVVGVDDEQRFLHEHPIGALWGVGPVTERQLASLGIVTVGDLARLPREALIANLGPASGAHLHDLANGIDDRPVVVDAQVKSISQEETFAHDRHAIDELRADVVGMADQVADRARRRGLAGRTVQLKVRYRDFTTVARSRTLDRATDQPDVIRSVAWELLAELPVERGVRLVGVGIANLVDGDDGGRGGAGEQLSFDELPGLDADGDGAGPGGPDERARRAAATDAVDRVRRRFGDDAIGSAGARRRRRDDDPAGDRTTRDGTR
ncbi:MAG: DNA polymerase IV [Microthrixaceae bacterium]